MKTVVTSRRHQMTTTEIPADNGVNVAAHAQPFGRRDVLRLR